MLLFLKKIQTSFLGIFVLSLSFAFVFFAESANAQFNPEINYQGKLTNATGVSVPDGNYNMRFWLHSGTSTPTSSALWTEDRTGVNKVSVANGLFSVMLGSVSAFAGLDFNQVLYLGVEIGGVSAVPSWDGEMSPRKIIGAVPVAFVAERALSADSISGFSTSSFLRSDDSGVLAATTSATSTLLTLIQNGTGSLLRLFSSSTEVLTVLNNGKLGLGTTTPSAKLTIQGTAGDNSPTFRVASSSGESTLSLLSNGNLELGGQLISAGINWTPRAAAEQNDWRSITYGNGLFVAVAYSGTNRVMTSPDGINWTPRTAAEANSWNSVTYGNGLFVAVASGGTNRVMTSPDGINWTPRAAAEQNDWRSITYGNGLFVAVADGGSGTNRVMTSPDGINWTPRAAAEQNYWNSITYGNGLFVAVAYSGSGTNRVMTSGHLNSISLAHNNIYQGGMSIYDSLRIGTTTSALASLLIQGTPDKNPFMIASSSGANLLTLDKAGNLGVGTSSTSSKLIIQGTAGASNSTFTIASSSGESTLSMLANGNLELGGRLINAGIKWATSSVPVAGNWWRSVTYGNGLFVAVSYDGTNRVMTSPDGKKWTASTTPDGSWMSVTYGNGLFVAVGGDDGTNRVMTSPDGKNWTPRTSAEVNGWAAVTYGNGLFVAVAANGTNRVMTSADGINWTPRAAAEANYWTSVTYGNGLFVAVAANGTNRVMTSPDGKNWTAHAAAGGFIYGWQSVTYGNGLFVAVASGGTNSVMTSPDGISWNLSTLAEANNWKSVTYGNGLFVAVASNGTNRVMTSPDGINWTARAMAVSPWQSITYGNGLFVAVALDWANDGTNGVMTSGHLNSISLAHNNIYQGGMSIYDSLRIGTTTSALASLLIQGTPDKNPFMIASSSGANLLTLDKAGNLGVGTSSPSSKLTVAGSANITGSLSVAATTTTENLLVNSTTTTNNLAVNGTGTIQKLFVNDNLGLGTTTALSKLAMERLSYGISGVVGMDQYFTLNNATVNAVQIANNLLLKTTNTATSTIVGGLWKVEDSTVFGNTVRGLEVQTDRGTNTLGENTAISGYARTFGLKGITSGDAGGAFEPAGVFAETKGTTQSNALRAYSSTITTAALVKVFQDTSNFAGTGLLMNFGNAGGTFSSSSSLFIDLKNAGTSVFKVGSRGMLTIGDGTTNNSAGLQIGFGGLCVDNDGSCMASTTGRISAVDYHTGNSDLAEMYFSKEDLLAGEVVYAQGGLSVGKASSSTKDKIIGVVSTKPGLLLGFDDSSLEAGETGFPVALSGRVPVRLSNENGEIKTGDELTLSSLPGVVMKATSTGKIVGVALEDFDENRAYSDTFINQFGDDISEQDLTPADKDDDPRIDDGCYFGGGNSADKKACVPLKTAGSDTENNNLEIKAEEKKQTLEALEDKESEVVVLENGEEVKVGQIVMFVSLKQKYLDIEGEMMIKALLANENEEVDRGYAVWQKLVDLANRFMDGVLSVLTLKADRVEVKNELCVDGVCVTADDLRKIINNGGVESSAGSTGGSGAVNGANEGMSGSEGAGAANENEAVSEGGGVVTGGDSASTTEESTNEGGISEGGMGGGSGSAGMVEGGVLGGIGDGAGSIGGSGTVNGAGAGIGGNETGGGTEGEINTNANGAGSGAGAVGGANEGVDVANENEGVAEEKL